MKRTSLIPLLFIFLFTSAITAKAQEIKLVANLSKDLGTSDYRLMESVEMNGNLYFTTWAARGTQLWRYNGTNANLIYEWPLGPLGVDYAVNKLYVYNNHLLMTGIDSAHGKELWISDGTAAGTRILKDMVPGVEPSFGVMPLMEFNSRLEGRFFPFVPFDGKLCFVAGDKTYNDVWITDGSVSGTKRLQLLDPGSGRIILSQLAAFNGNLLLNVATQSIDFGLFASDGGAGGGSLLRDKVFAQDYFEGQGKLFFSRNGLNGLWTSDGTASGTFPLDSTISSSADRIWLRNKLYFFNRYLINKPNRAQLYTSDGTVSGTGMIADTIEEPVRFTNSQFPPLQAQVSFPVIFGSDIYFCGRNELWKSDGTSQGTKIAVNLEVDKLIGLPAYPTALTVAGNNMYFKAWDSIRLDLFVSDGTKAGTWKLPHPAADYSEYSYFNGAPMQARHPDEFMIVYNNQLLFTGFYDNGTGKGLYKIDLPPTSVPALAGLSASLIAFPNPSASTFTIRYPKGFYDHATVCDVSGRLLYQQAVQNGGSDILNLRELAPGRYFVRLSGTGPVIATTVVISH